MEQYPDAEKAAPVMENLNTRALSARPLSIVEHIVNNKNNRTLPSSCFFCASVL
jgi:hypothetical protein